jgi:uncharacterized membrane protein
MTPLTGAALQRSGPGTGVKPVPGRGRRAGRWVPAALVALAVIPVMGGTARLTEICGGPELIPTDHRFAASPYPVAVHIAAAIGYALLGAFQFSAWLRRRHRDWHRRVGRILVAAGLAVAGSGLWMTLFYAGAPGGNLLWGVRLVVGSAMAASIVLGFAAIRRRDIAAHRAWMIRAYALGLGAGTQIFTQGVGEGVFGAGDLSTGLSVASGWVINAVVAEYAIRRRR